MTRFPSLTDAVAQNLFDADTMAFEGFSYLAPYAAAHVPDLLGDGMIGMGMVPRLVHAYGGNPGVGRTRLPRGRRRARDRDQRLARTALATEGRAR